MKQSIIGPGVLGLVLFVTACGPAFADPAPPPSSAPVQSSLGVQLLLATGVHSDIAGKQYGLGGGPLFQVNIVPARRIAFHAEGIPVVGIPQRASATYGQATPSLGVFNGSLRVALDARSRYWIGAGTTIINQRTPLPAQNQVVSSRLAGARYELFARVPLSSARRFVEFSAGAAPRLWGTDRYIFSDGSPSIDKPEKAAEEDLSIAYGVRHERTELLFGLRSINFSAMFVNTGLAADRNNGAGIMIEWRHFLGF